MQANGKAEQQQQEQPQQQTKSGDKCKSYMMTMFARWPGRVGSRLSEKGLQAVCFGARLGPCFHSVCTSPARLGYNGGAGRTHPVKQ